VTEVFSNGLSAEEVERLSLLAEECGEVIQAIGKILRHGYSSTHPVTGVVNGEALEKEVGDVLCAICYMTSDLSGNAIEAHQRLKLRRVREYLHHQTIHPDECELRFVAPKN